jgi:hypothetical protein
MGKQENPSQLHTPTSRKVRLKVLGTSTTPFKALFNSVPDFFQCPLRMATPQHRAKDKIPIIIPLNNRQTILFHTLNYTQSKQNNRISYGIILF